MIRTDALIERNATIRLMRQRDIAYPLEVIDRLFREDYSVRAPKARFLAICEEVRQEMILSQGEGKFTFSAERQLKAWTRPNEGDPWFTLVDDPEIGLAVQVLPQARAVHDLITLEDSRVVSVSAESLGGLFSSLTEAATRIRGDDAALIGRLEREIDERRMTIDRLRAGGVEPVSDKDKRRFASDLARLVLDVQDAIRLVPEQLEATMRRAQDAYHHSEGTHGSAVNEVLTIFMDQRSSPGYGVLSSLSDLATDEVRRQDLEDALDLVVEACAEHLTPEMRDAARGLLTTVSEVSRQVIRRNTEASAILTRFVRSETFEQRRGEMRALSDLAEAMRAFAPHARISSRSLKRFGLPLTRARNAPARMFDLRLSGGLPERRDDVILEAVEAAEAGASTVRRVRELIERGTRLDRSNIEARIRQAVLEHGPLPLSSLFRHDPPVHGSEEVAIYLQAALERVPAAFLPDWWFRIELPLSEGGPRWFVLPDPVFSLNGLSEEAARREVAHLRPARASAIPGGGRIIILDRRPEALE